MKNFYLFSDCLLIFFFLSYTTNAQTLQTVTTNGRTTNQWIQITGSGGILSTGKGLELSASITGNGDAFVQGYNRVLGIGTNLHLQGNGGNTYINENGGNVGIGTLSPNQKLHIDGGANSTYLKVSRDLGYIQLGAVLNFNAIYSRTNTDAARDLQFVIGATTAATILANGNVGIGTVSPSQLLHVNGTTLSNVVWIGSGITTTNASGYLLAVNGAAIFTKAVVKLQTNWPDHVFNKNYKLMPLDAVENFIKINNHLPDMPSTDEMKKKDGMDLGEMNTKLLQKVEELTLYVIELKKQSDKQQQEINELKKQNSK